MATSESGNFLNLAIFFVNKLNIPLTRRGTQEYHQFLSLHATGVIPAPPHLILGTEQQHPTTTFGNVMQGKSLCVPHLIYGFLLAESLQQFCRLRESVCAYEASFVLRKL